MQRFLAACVAVVIGVGIGAAGAAADNPGNATILRVKQPSAGGEAFFGNCPDVEFPPVGTTCRESYVLVFRETRVLGGGSNAPSQAVWSMYAQTYTLFFPTPDGPPDFLAFADGFTEGGVVASSDDQHVSFLTAAARIPLSDGSTFDFRGTWRGVGDRWVYGNNGPLNDAEGVPRHFVSRCETVNANAHQTGRNATMAGTLNGAPVHSYTFTFTADIFYNHFVYIRVEHGGASCG